MRLTGIKKIGKIWMGKETENVCEGEEEIEKQRGKGEMTDKLNSLVALWMYIPSASKETILAVGVGELQ